MSRWYGPQVKGASREMRTRKRAEAEARQRAAILSAHPDGKCTCKRGEKKHVVARDPFAEKLLEEIFRKPATG